MYFINAWFAAAWRSQHSLSDPTTNHNVWPSHPTLIPTPWSEPLRTIRGWWNETIQPFYSRFQPFLSRL